MRRLIALLVMPLLVVGTAFAADQPKLSDLDKVMGALPTKAYATPQKPRKLLVFTLCNGFPHSSVQLGAQAFQAMGKSTGAFEAVISDDIAMFEPETLAQFDGVCMMNTTGELFTPKNFDKLSPEEQKAATDREARLKKSFLEFVKGGKGLIGVHAATDCFYKWAEYGEMMGGYFSGHPWHEPVAIKLDDPNHPLNQMFLGKDFTVTDEIYQFKTPYSRDKLRVLLSLDANKVDMTKDSINRKDKDFAVSWVNTAGKGRIFYCSLGHREEIFWNPAILNHFLAGTQYALGDLPADATPSAALPPDTTEKGRQQALESLQNRLPQLASEFVWGQDTASLVELDKLIVASFKKPEERAKWAATLLKILGDPETTDAGRDFAARRLVIVADKGDTKALAALLTNEKTEACARYVLERMEGSAAEKALIKQLSSAEGKARIAYLNSLGARRDARGATAVAKYVNDADPKVAAAAYDALGKIANKKALAVIAKNIASAPDAVKPVAAQAWLACADAKATAGDKKRAKATYAAIDTSNDAPAAVRAAAFRGLVLQITDEEALPMVSNALVGKDRLRQQVALQLVAELGGGTKTTETLAAKVASLSPEEQPLLITALASRGDKAAVPVVLGALKSEDKKVRIAALEALPYLSDPAAVPAIAEIAANAKGRDERTTARRSLEILRAEGIDAAILAGAATGDPALRAPLIRALGDRKMSSAFPVVCDYAAKDESEVVRAAALEAIALLGTDADCPNVAMLLAKSKGETERSEAIAAYLALLRQTPPITLTSRPILDALPKAESPEATAALLRLLSNIGDNAALVPLREALGSSNEIVRGAAVRTLAAWPNNTPLMDLLKTAQSDKDETLRILALRGVIRQLPMPTGRSAEAQLAIYQKVYSMTSSLDDKKALLGAAAFEHHPKAIAWVQTLAAQPDLKEDVEQTLAKMKDVKITGTASAIPQYAFRALDGKQDTRWDTAAFQRGGEWFMADLGFEKTLTGVTLDTRNSGGDAPDAIEVYVGNDPNNLGEPLFKGPGANPLIHVTFPPTKGRYVKILQTGSKLGLYWSIHELTFDTK